MTTRTKKELKVEEVPAVEKAAHEDETTLTKPLELFFEHQKKAFTEMTKAVESLIPKGTREHGETAFKEVIESYRSFINSAIDEIIKLIKGVKPGAEEKEKKEVEKEKPPMA